MAMDEVFSKIAEHMQYGIMLHEQIANCYGFLSLQGYKRCHEYHFFSEICNYRCLWHYYLENCNKLIKINEVKTPSIINTGWYKYSREEVDVNTKRTTIRELMKTWVDWEIKTKQLLESSYKTLYDEGQIAAAMKISCFIKDVDKELKYAENKKIKLETTGYDIGVIIAEQDYLHEKYENKIANMQLL